MAVDGMRNDGPGPAAPPETPQDSAPTGGKEFDDLMEQFKDKLQEHGEGSGEK